MELKQFVKSVLKDLIEGVEEVRKESARDVTLASHKESNQTVEFDIAVTVEDATSGTGRAGIKVFQLIEGGGELSKEMKNSSVSRVKFGVKIDPWTKSEHAQFEAESRVVQSQSYI